MNALSDLFRRLLFSRLLWFAVIGIATLLFLVSQAGWYVSGNADTPAKADLIVALGGDAGARIIQADKLYAAGYSLRVLLTGLENGAEQTRSHYLEWRAAFLLDQKVPRDAIYFDLRSRNTWEEAQNTRRLMENNGWRTVLVVSDPPHMRRLSWVWGKVFEGGELQYRLVAAPMSGWDPARWWRDEKSAQYVLMELIKLGYYHASY